jgi:hypothetical protein
MARFRGTVSGGRGTASRLGHSTRGLTTCAASFSGAVEVHLYYNKVTDTDMAEVRLTTHMGKGSHRVLYQGPICG